MMYIHCKYIHRCLTLAERGRGCTGINPMVGAVLVRNGRIVAEGFHEGYGTSHAEQQLLQKYEQKISSNDVLYVNLEPCCHTEKKTPPCTEAIIRRGIKHVVVGMLDPNPKVSGRGVTFLRENGIEVIGPVERAACEWLNRGFVALMTKGRPWVTLKRAIALSPEEGGGNWVIAHPDGSPMKITSQGQDAWSHEHLRARHDAILVGVETVVRDNPNLTIRNSEFGIRNANRENIPHSAFRIPHSIRIVLDPHLRLPPEAKMVSGELAKGTAVVIRDGKESKEGKDTKESKEKMRMLQERGVRILCVPCDAKGHFDLHALCQTLTTPDGDFHGITSILVEGGARTWKTFQDAGMVDMEVTLVGGG